MFLTASETSGKVRSRSDSGQRLRCLPSHLATVHELRFGVADPSQKKSDLYVTNMAEDGLPTIVDVGVTHSLADTSCRSYGAQSNTAGKVRRLLCWPV